MYDANPSYINSAKASCSVVSRRAVVRIKQEKISDLQLLCQRVGYNEKLYVEFKQELQ